MKKLATLLAFSTVLAYGSMARAADLPEAPVVYDWTGFYLGGNIGYGFAGNDKVGITEKDTIDGDITFFGKPADLKLSGIFGGPEIGYNFQAGQVVFGAQRDGGVVALVIIFLGHPESQLNTALTGNSSKPK